MTANKVKVFDMYSGDKYPVKMQFRNELADVVIDQFGRDVMMIPLDDGHFTITVDLLRLHILNVDYFVLLAEKPQQIVDLFEVILDRAGGQIPALAVERELIVNSG